LQSRRSLEQKLLAEIGNGLWHTTHPDRFRAILERGAILPEPDVPDRERWKTSGGEAYYSFVRSIDGVSLFDFDHFEPESYSTSYPLSSWSTFVPHVESWKGAVWVEINRIEISRNFISGPELVLRWNREKAFRHTIMPKIEAAHIGPLPLKAFIRAIFIGAGDDKFYELEISNFDFLAYEKLLDVWRSRNAR
jgi:hypothetical protein